MKNRLITTIFAIVFLINFNLNAQTQAAASAEALAKQLANPVANLISVPLQNNFDFNVGPLEGFKYTLNIQPVVPISIGENWNMISRTIAPIISQNDVTAHGESEFGLGDIVQSIFFSPKAPTESGWVWGVGPIFLLPTATDDALGIDKWAMGPNAVFLKLQGQWTYGALVNHMWSFAGNGYSDVNATFFQPFATFATPDGASYTIASENTQDWGNDIFGGFVTVLYAHVLKVKSQMLQLGVGPKFYYGNNPFNPEWGIRGNVVLLFPK